MTTTANLGTKPYQELREVAEAHHGRMWHERAGYLHGAWIVEIGDARRVFESNGAGHPELDRLYVRKVVFPRHWSDYTHQLVGDAKDVFLSMVK